MKDTTRDALPIYVLAVILSVFSILMIHNVRKISETVEKQDFIAECLTPGTRCFMLSQAVAEERRKISSAENKCLIVGALQATQGIPLEDILGGFDSCVQGYVTPG